MIDEPGHTHMCVQCKRPFPCNIDACAVLNYTCEDCQARLDAEAEAQPHPEQSDDDEPALPVESAVDPPASEDDEVEQIEEGEQYAEAESEDEPEEKPQHSAHHTRARSAKKKKK